MLEVSISERLSHRLAESALGAYGWRAYGYRLCLKAWGARSALGGAGQRAARGSGMPSLLLPVLPSAPLLDFSTPGGASGGRCRVFDRGNPENPTQP